MTEPDDLRFFFARRKRVRVGLLSPGDILTLLLRGELDAVTMVRPVTAWIMRPLASGELAALLSRAGSVWRRWGASGRYFLFLLALFLLHGVTFFAVRGHAERSWPYAVLPIVLAGAAGILCWLFLLWRVLLGSGRAALKRVLPLLIPVWNLYWVWPGFFALGSTLRLKLRREAPAAGPPPWLFAVVIVCGGIWGAAALPLLLFPISRTLAAVHECLFLGMLTHALTLLLLFWADQSAMRLLLRRVEHLIDTLPMHALEADPRPLLAAEDALRRRTAPVTALTGLAVLLAGLLPLTAANIRETGLHAVYFVQSELPQVAPETPGARQALLRETALAAQALTAARHATVPERAAALCRLADCLVLQQEFYTLFETQMVLNCGALLVQEGGALLSTSELAPAECAALAAYCEASERRLRQMALTAVARTAQDKLAALPGWDPVRNVAILETAELLPFCCRCDFYEFAQDLERPAGNHARTIAGRVAARLEALSFFLRANTLILDFRLLGAAAAVRSGARSGNPPRNPLTGQALVCRETPDGFRIESGTWPGRSPRERLFRPEIAVKVRRGAAE